MIYLFDLFRLDTQCRELRRSGGAVAVEPQVFDLLVYLIEERHRVVSKADLVDRIWSGRAISDWTVLGRIKSLRRALGDDGATQRFIRTLRRRGFRFVMDIRPRAPDLRAATPAEPRPGRRPCIAVLPFTLTGEAGPWSGIAEALPRELIRALSDLPRLDVLSHGWSFRFRGEAVRPPQVLEQLGAQYCLSGYLEIRARRLEIDVELADTRSGLVLWAARRGGALDDLHRLRADLAASLVAVVQRELSRDGTGLVLPGWPGALAAVPPGTAEPPLLALPEP